MEARRRPEVETYEQYVGDAKASGGARECEEHGTRKREVWFPFFFDLYRFEGSRKRDLGTLKTAQGKTKREKDPNRSGGGGRRKSEAEAAAGRGEVERKKDQANKSTGWMPWH